MIEEIYVGTGGWYDYKKDLLSPGMRLKVYSKTFRFVEVNSTFYKIFDPKTIERWRHQVPYDFEFSVKCYQGLTHKVGIRPTEDAYKTINKMLICCKILNAKILVFEIPASLLLDEKFITDVKQFFSGISLNGVQIAWQFRKRISELPDGLINLIRDLNIIHVVDLSWEDVRYDNDITYTRVFGNPKNDFRLGEYDYSTIASKVRKTESKITYVSAHGPKMVHYGEKLDKILRPFKKIDKNKLSLF